MFTGLIEEVGIINSVKKAAQGAVISVDCSKISDDLKIGDSISIDGACQTAVKIRANGFDVEASLETLNLAIFKNYKPGTKVNLERAMPACGRFGGHIVTGHVDGTGEFKKKINQGIADLFYFSAPENVAKYLVYKGSVCVNGISLTIASLEGNVFSVSVIPLTVKHTNLAYLTPNDKVNLESDILAKYIEKFVSRADNKINDNKTENITDSYLQEHGFI